MENLSLNDPTQRGVLPHLQGTERLLARAASRVSGDERSAKVWALPDLYCSREIERISKGIFSGAAYSWDASEPMVPTDAHVHCCGVSVFKVGKPPESVGEFASRLQHAKDITENASTYKWNVGGGNHFVILGESQGSPGLEDGHYAIFHSSGNETAKAHNGLYPKAGNWYSHRIETIEDRSLNRAIRFIRGKVAEQFIKLAHMEETHNTLRHRYLADLIFGDENIDSEILSVQHYGMPSANSVAVGCQWVKDRIVPLLTAPGKPVYLVRPQEGGPNDVTIGNTPALLFPHGLGRECTEGIQIQYEQDGVIFNGQRYTEEQTLMDDPRFRIRPCEISDEGSLPEVIQAMLRICKGDITGTIRQVFSYCKGNHLGVR